MKLHPNNFLYSGLNWNAITPKHLNLFPDAVVDHNIVTLI